VKLIESQRQSGRFGRRRFRRIQPRPGTQPQAQGQGQGQARGQLQARPVTQGARRRRRLLVVVAASAVLVVALGLVRYEVMPRYRPNLKAGEQFGIDVSNHQGEIRWDQVAASNISFAYIKATEGQDFRDRRFAANWAQARAAGIARGAYHFFTLCSSGAAQAKNFLAALPADPDALPPAVDLEFSSCSQRPDRATVQSQLRTFVNLVEARVGQPVVIYGLAAFEKAYPIESVLPRDRWRRSLFRRPVRHDWAIWQVSSLTRVKGIDGPVDLDVRRGSGQ